MKSKYIIVTYTNGSEENVKVALSNEHITLNDLDRFNIDYLIKKKDEKEIKSFIATILKETSTYMVVELDIGEEERESSDKMVINYGERHENYIYGIGKKVRITYSGYILETYPAQINTNDIFVVE